MTDPIKTCAACGHSQASGEFCEACGAKLPMEGLYRGEVSEAAGSRPMEGAAGDMIAKTCAVCGHQQATGEYCEVCGTKLPMEGITTPGAAAGTLGTGASSSGYAPPPGAPPQPGMGAGAPPQPGMAGGAPPPVSGYSPPPMYSPPPRGNGFWSRFFDLSFEHFITPSIIKVLFVIAVVVIGLGVLGWIIIGFVSFGAVGIAILIGALVAGFIYLLLARVFLEMVVVFFRIRDDTEELIRLKK
ncbi:MAG: DUF4282 domain-containing protein [Actinobacteria bacterium]|nr:DUF4282 domain-containing protein [Actinomycetota bacterium]